MAGYKGDEVIDVIDVDKDELSKVIDNYHALDYVVEVNAEPIIGDFGRYIEHRYEVTVIKPYHYEIN